MPEYEKVGSGALWIRESKTGKKYLNGNLEFSYQGHPVTVRIAVFKNGKKEGEQPDYNIVVNSWEHTKPREVKPPVSAVIQDEGVPF